MTKEYEDYLVHHGIKGQKWGVRNYQNEDGTLTAAGKSRYESLSPRQKKQYDSLPQHWKNVMDKKMDSGKSFTKSMNETAKRRNAIALPAALGAITLASAGMYALTYFGTKGLMTAGMKTASAISNKMKTSQSWHNLKNRVKAMKTGDIVLGKKDYTLSGGWLAGSRR